MSVRFYILIFLSVLISEAHSLHGQIGLGMHFSNDFFHHLTNSEENSAYSDASSILIAPSAGPRFYFGREKWSFSLQTALGIAPFSWDWDEYKGLGTLFMPSSLMFNYGGLSGFTEAEPQWGFSVGAGYFLGLTDLYFRGEEIKGEGPQLIRLPYLKVSVGFGAKGTAAQWYFRYGRSSDSEAFFSTGLALDVNFLQRRNYR